ncbi:MAG: iron-containing alcohol dehydrogenase [Chloroflexi bacterium]|nr:iron-containing alcohol dehydrogenase [Chloroflexota bacterium]
MAHTRQPDNLFRYAPSPSRVVVGHGALERLGEEAARAGVTRALLVCGQSVATKTDLVERAQAALGERYAGVFEGVQAESPLRAVEAGVAAARAVGADGIVAIGGGSAVVSGRAIVMLLAEKGDVHELCTQYPPGGRPVSPRLIAPKIPNLLVLTTPTTASGRAASAILDPAQQRRLELFDPKTRAAAILCDAGALLTAPRELFLATSAWILAGVVDGIQSPNLNPLGEADLRHALRLLRRAMPLVAQEPENPEPRLELALAAVLCNRAGDAGNAARGGAMTALVHLLQVHQRVPQGVAASALLAAVLRAQRTEYPAGAARLAWMMGVCRPGIGEEEAAWAAEEALLDLLGQAGLPQRLRDLGIPLETVEATADTARHDFFFASGSGAGGPEGLLAVLREAW